MSFSFDCDHVAHTFFTFVRACRCRSDRDLNLPWTHTVFRDRTDRSSNARHTSAAIMRITALHIRTRVCVCFVSIMHRDLDCTQNLYVLQTEAIGEQTCAQFCLYTYHSGTTVAEAFLCCVRSQCETSSIVIALCVCIHIVGVFLNELCVVSFDFSSDMIHSV